ncbi:MAG: LacI family transcriptional regulator [Phycisphaerae bacterium]|nr:LacI family transcriptional regulator [Phycisphaerae bacterium]
MAEKVLLRDVAKRARVCKGTASVVLNNKSTSVRIGEATRKRIINAARELNYSPNLLARSLSNGKTRTIGFLTGSPALGMVSTMETTLDDCASETGYGVYIAHTRGELDLTVKRANEFVDRGVDGLIIRGSFPSVSAKELEAKLNFSVPTVFLSIGAPRPFPCRQVCEDGAIGVAQAVDHLYELGHRGIYMFRGYWNGWEKSPRFAGFRKAINEHGLGDPDQRICEVSSTYLSKIEGRAILDMEEIYSNTKNFLQAHPDCTAILCSSSMISLAVLSTLLSLGKKVPEDISLVGFGSSPATLYSLPPVSVVDEPANKLMLAAFDMLMDEIDKKDDEPREKVVSTEYVPRRSTGPVRKN